MKLSAVNYLVTAIFAIAIKATNSYPYGAPHYTCRSQIPIHINCTQNGPAPYRVVVNEDVVKAHLVPTGHKYSVTLASLDDSVLQTDNSFTVTLASLDDAAFRGFICAVSDARDNTHKPVGKMSLSSPSTQEVQLLNCTRAATDTGVTHTSNSDKHNVQFDWSPPSDSSPGRKYKLRCTIVMEFVKCWTNLQAIIIPWPAITSKNKTDIVGTSDDNTRDRINSNSAAAPLKDTKPGRTNNCSKSSTGLTTPTTTTTDINTGQKSSSRKKPAQV